MRCQIDWGMSKNEKLLAKAERNPEGLKYSEFKTLLSANGFSFARQVGSHEIWKSREHGASLTIQSKKGKAKGYQVRQFLKAIKEE